LNLDIEDDGRDDWETPMSNAPQRRDMIVQKRRPLTHDIEEFTLAAADGAELPSFGAGAHVTVETPSGASRRYSLVNSGTDPEYYVIAVKREPDSRGGSQSMHDEALENTVLRVSDPENTFPLVSATNYLLIAGGIGITPIQAMARQLAAEGKRFRLVYCSRSTDDAAYLDDVRALGDGVTIHHDQGDPDQLYDFWDFFEEPDDSQVFCCGPHSLMEEIKALSGHWPEGSIHFEDFKPIEVVKPDDKPFAVTIAASGRRIEVPADRSILEALRDAGESTVSSCESGTCGTCRCSLIEGEVDHRDMVLRPDERDSHIMICVSRSAGGDLVIDP
jgi:phthalate 4,5-dioxygenase reductase subunit